MFLGLALHHSIQLFFPADLDIQLNLPTTATLGTEESGRCREVAVSGGSTVQSNLFNKDTKGAEPSVRFTQVSVL